MPIQMNNDQFQEMMAGVFETLEKHESEIRRLKAQNPDMVTQDVPVARAMPSAQAVPVIGGRRTRCGRRKKRTRRRKSRRKRKGGHAGGRQYTYTELAAMINANEQRVYYLYVIDARNEPPLEQAYGKHIHRFKFDGSGNKIAITGHRVGHHNQNPVYTIPNPAIATVPTATEVTNQFYNPGQGLRREFRDGLTDMMGNLQMGGRRKKRTRRRKSRGKSRRRMRGKRKGKSRRKRKR